MRDEAIAKINAEMQKNPNDLYTEIIGQYIIDRCSDEAVAAKAAAPGKSLAGAMSAVMAAAKAKKSAKNSVAVLTPAAVFGEVDKYLGIPEDRAAQAAAMMAAGGQAPAVPEVKPAGKVSLDLADFL